ARSLGLARAWARLSEPTDPAALRRNQDARIHHVQSRAEDPAAAGRRLQDRREPGNCRLSLQYLWHPRDRADPIRSARAGDLARMVFLRRNRARPDQPLRYAPPRRSEATLWRSTGRTGKRRRLLRDAAASCRAGLAGGA